VAKLIYEIRLYRPNDAAAVAAIFPASVRALAGQHYSAEQVLAWANCAQSVEEVARRCADGRFVWVAATSDDIPVAFIDLEKNGYVDMLFCLAEHARMGLANRLHAALEQTARTLKISKLTTDASEVAKPVFEGWGYHSISRNVFTRDGVTMHNYSMLKVLL
jgi:putative acetyltransferase